MEAVAVSGEVFRQILAPVLDELSLSIDDSGQVSGAA